MKMSDLIGNWFIELPTVEQALQRGDVESKISNLSDDVIEHLIKILKWKDPLNYTKHVKDTNGWLNRISRYEIKKQGTPKEKDYFQWIFTDNVRDVSRITLYINGMPDYHGLPVIRTDEEVYAIIHNLMVNVCKELSIGQFKSIVPYLPVNDE